MMHSKKKIIKRVVIACLILAVFGVWLAGYIDVNKRFPKPEQQVHSMGEWVRTGETSIKVNSVEYMPQEEANSQYGSELLPDSRNNSNTYYFIAKIDVKNKTDKEIKLSKTLLEHLGLEIYPVGVLTYGETMEDGELTSIKLKAGEQREIVLHFIMTQGVLRDDRRWMLKKSQIRIVLSNYPVHEIIVLDDIKGL